MKVLTLKKRKDFVRAAKSFKVVTSGLVLQAAFALPKPEDDCCFVGYTTSKKIGKAHIRNFVRRRLRAAVALVLADNALSGIDYVLIGRHNTANLDFAYLTRRLKKALAEINAQILAQGNSYDKGVDNRAC
jgi:ribonuclease P protein component